MTLKYMEIEQLLEVPTQLDENDYKEQLNILVSSGKCKEMIGKELTHEQVTKLSEEETKKFHKRYEAALASKTTDAVADSAIKLATKILGLTLPIDDLEALRRDIREDYVIAQELKMTCGWLSLKCGKLMAVASAALHIAQHVDLDVALSSWSDFKKERGITYLPSLRLGAENEEPKQVTEEPMQVPISHS